MHQRSCRRNGPVCPAEWRGQHLKKQINPETFNSFTGY
jgi:hypothetical protein